MTKPISLTKAASDVRELALGKVAMRGLVGPDRCFGIAPQEGERVRVDLSVAECELLYYLWLAKKQGKQLGTDASQEMQRLLVKANVRVLLSGSG